MGKLAEAAMFYAKFAGKVLPEAYKQRSLAREELRQCLPLYHPQGYVERIRCQDGFSEKRHASPVSIIRH